MSTETPTRESLAAIRPYHEFDGIDEAMRHHALTLDRAKAAEAERDGALLAIELGQKERDRLEAKLAALQPKPTFEPDEATRIYAEMFTAVDELDHSKDIIDIMSGNASSDDLAAIAVLRKALDERKPFAGLPRVSWHSTKATQIVGYARNEADRDQWLAALKDHAK